MPLSRTGCKHLYRFIGESKSRFVFTTRSGRRLSYRNAYRDIAAVCAVAGVPVLHPHCFRHTFAVNYMRRGGDIYRLSRILGHASLMTTQIYLRSMGIEQLCEGHDALSMLGG